MGSQEIRKPQQQRSIEKRKRIIEAGYELFCEKGYHNTNTAEIAKLAGVSTGIVYSYFRDKKDIFINMVEMYANKVAEPVYDIVRTVDQPFDLDKTLRKIIVTLIESHTMSKSVHEEMQALAHTDEEIGEVFYRFQADLAAYFISIMDQIHLHPTDPLEKIHLIIDIIENLSHEMVYQKHEYLDYDRLIDIAVKIIVDMLTS